MVAVTNRLILRPTIWVIAVNALALIAFAGSPWAAEYPAAGLSILAFLAVQILCPACRPSFAAPLCPVNIAQAFFWVQMVLVPLLVGLHGVSLATLPAMPSDQAMNTAICLRILGYISLAVAYQCIVKPTPDASHEDVGRLSNPAHNASQSSEDIGRLSNPAHSGLWILIVPFAILGLVGCYLYYRGIGGYIEYLTSPVYHHERELEEVTLATAAGNLLRPFLGFAIVLGWSWWMSRENRPASAVARLVVTAAAAVFLLLASFTYNRGTTLAPILALAAAYSLHVRRLSFKVVAVATLVALAGAFTFGWYRSTNLEISDVSTEEVGGVWNDEHMVEFVQIYAGGPQLTAHLIDHVDFEGLGYRRQTLIPSILYPIPVLGKPYREMSGVVIFNQSIYGDIDVNDQIIAYDSELFLNFHIPGVIIGYALLGWLLAFFQGRFLNTADPVESYACLLLALWTVFPGSVAVTSQSYVYSFWPIYAYLLVRWLVVAPERRPTLRNLVPAEYPVTA